MKTFFCLLLLSTAVVAQDTVAPTSGEKTGPVRGENAGDYNVVQSWELGYRFASIGGDPDKYRADVGYREGIRLLGSSLTVNSKDGHGRWFDEIVLSTEGLGNDPYESATFRVQKNRWYRYDLLWRENDYFNPGLTVAAGEHLENTSHRWQDHDLVLFPQSRFHLRAGYSRVGESGPALTTEQEFDTRGDVYPLFRNIRRQYNEYRLAGDVLLRGLRFTAQRRWEYFKEDTSDSVTAPIPGAPPAVLNSFDRAQPYRGRTPGWMGNLWFERNWIAINARMTYSGGRGDFVQDETAIGTDRFGAAQNREVLVTGNGDRLVAAGDFNVTLFPASRFSLTNSTSASNTRTLGQNDFTEFDQLTLSFSDLNFEFLGIRLITNATDARYRLSKRFDFFGGFRYADRLIRSTQSGGTTEQTNATRAGVAGFNWLPAKNLRVHAEAELGRNSDPFTPISLRNYHAIRVKARYRARTFAAGAGYEENYNNNSIVVTAYSSRARSWTAEASWSGRPWLSLDASYSRLHLDTIGGIDFFAGSPRALEITGTQSIYVSNIHAANLGMRFALTRRADLYLGYNIVKDTGDGRSSLASQPSAVAQIFYNVQTFPLTYQTPLARVSVRLTEKLRYNVGYQYYGYKENFGLLSTNQGYRAHTGYTSLLWSF